MHRKANKNGGDRFIPRRENFDISSYQIKVPTPSIKFDEGNDCSKPKSTALSTWNRRIYNEKLWDTMAPVGSKILNFTETDKRTNHLQVVKSLDWPVYARKQPVIKSPLIILDMPQDELNICHHITDWNKMNFIGSVFEHEVYLWHANKDYKEPITNSGFTIEPCLKWIPSGTHFSTALVGKSIGIWDLMTQKKINQAICGCRRYCSINVMEWSKENVLIAGCSTGCLSLWSFDLKLLKIIYPAHKDGIVAIKLSYNENYLTTSSLDCTVRVWLWPVMKECFEICYNAPIRGLAWHPWKYSLLAVGGGTGHGAISLWNVACEKRIARQELPIGVSCIDSMIWNEKSGELVVSYWKPGNNDSDGENSIMVLSDLNSHVDSVNWHAGRVLYLMWNYDNTQLATVGTEENLCIWNFFGRNSNFGKSTKKKAFSVNNLDNLNIFGKTLR